MDEFFWCAKSTKSFGILPGKFKASPENQKPNIACRAVLQGAYERAKKLITSKRAEHLALAAALIERESLDGDEIVAIVTGKADGKGSTPKQVAKDKGRVAHAPL